MTSIHIKHTNKHGHKHTVHIILAAKGSVHASTYFGRQHTLIGHGQKQACGLSHKQRCRHPLTAHITHGKVEHVISNHIAIQITTNLLGRSHRCIHVKPFAMRKLVGYHTHLYVTGNLQFTFDTLLSNLHLSGTAVQNRIYDKHHRE